MPQQPRCPGPPPETKGETVKRYLANFPKAALKKKPRQGKCPLLGCKGDSHTKGILCAKHGKRLWRMENPVNAHFLQIKDRAKKRGHAFTLTLADFIEIIADTGYLEGRGTSASALHLDRIDPTRGYERGNCRVLTAKENCQKAHEDKQRRRAHIEAKLGHALPQHDPRAGEEPEWMQHAPDFSGMDEFTPTDNEPF